MLTLWTQCKYSMELPFLLKQLLSQLCSNTAIVFCRSGAALSPLSVKGRQLPVSMTLNTSIDTVRLKDQYFLITVDRIL